MRAFACGGARLRGSKRQRAGGDVGVGVLLVGVGMTAVVLADTPATAQPDAEIAEQKARDGGVVTGLTR
ncbi:MAG TPA: hypothetical protein VGQ26_06195 [Streptosporangiaceae bacterium]|nr:hypothetical protein [Streptosporangiaceae bacterium]